MDSYNDYNLKLNRQQSLQHIDYDIIAEFSDDFNDDDFKPIIGSLVNFE